MRFIALLMADGAQGAHTCLHPQAKYVSVDSITTSMSVVYDAPRHGQVWSDTSTTATGFWDYIKEWGAEWMWEMIHPNCMDGFDLQWMIQMLKVGNLVGVTDGS